ncbi:hypothetical protein [Galbibacter sp. BG1]
MITFITTFFVILGGIIAWSTFTDKFHHKPNRDKISLEFKYNRNKRISSDLIYCTEVLINELEYGNEMANEFLTWSQYLSEMKESHYKNYTKSNLNKLLSTVNYEGIYSAMSQTLDSDFKVYQGDLIEVTNLLKQYKISYTLN